VNREANIAIGIDVGLQRRPFANAFGTVLLVPD
jgi:hypothetical protein